VEVWKESAWQAVLVGEKLCDSLNTIRKDIIMKNLVCVLSIGMAAAITLGGTIPSWAAPVLSSTAVVGTTAPTDVSNVYYRGHHRGRGVGPGLALGAIGLVGAGIAASAYRNNYYDNRGYGYDRSYGYEQNPGYYGPGYYSPGYRSGYRY
jgi:hypothetical protein